MPESMRDPEEFARQALRNHLKSLEKVSADVDNLFWNINWDELRGQKQHLLDTIAYCTAHAMKNKVEALDGILHLLDAIQDFAADKLEIPDVFEETDDE